MLTLRGWWFFIIVLGVLTVGLATGAGTVILLALTLLCWFLAQWLLFAVLVQRTRERLFVERELTDGKVPLAVLWARLPISVRVRLRCRGQTHFPFVSMVDRLPPLAR